MRVRVAKRSGVCALCRRPIEAGDSVLWQRGAGVRCTKPGCVLPPTMAAASPAPVLPPEPVPAWLRDRARTVRRVRREGFKRDAQERIDVLGRRVAAQSRQLPQDAALAVAVDTLRTLWVAASRAGSPVEATGLVEAAEAVERLAAIAER